MVVAKRTASRSELIGPILMENESDYDTIVCRELWRSLLEFHLQTHTKK